MLVIVSLVGCGAARPDGDDVDPGMPSSDADPGGGGGGSGGGGGGRARTIEIYSGDGEMVMGGWPGGDPLKVIVLDGDAPAPGVMVQWETTTGDMALTGEFQTGLTGHSTTDANGIARVGLRGEFLSQMTSAVGATVRASIDEGSIDFTTWSTYWTQQIPALPSTYVTVPDSIDLGTHPAGATLPGGIEVLVAFNSGTEGGRGMPGVGVRLTLGSDGTVDTAPLLACTNTTNGTRTGGTVFTDMTGRARCDVKLPVTPGHYSFGVYVGGASLHSPIFVDVQ